MVTRNAVAAIDRYTLGAGPLANVSGTVDDQTQPAEAEPQFAGRAGQRAAFVQSALMTREVSVEFQTPAYADQQALIQALDWPHTDGTHLLKAYWGDPANPTLCTADVAIKKLDRTMGSVAAVFDKADATWLSATSRKVGPTSFSANGALAVVNQGDVRVYPTYRIKWSTQRIAFSSAAGWRYYQPITITNATDRDWDNEPMFVDLGDTAALVTGSKALASGDDLRIWVEGQERSRTLITWNTKRTVVCFLVTIPRGESQTYYAVYGNSSAGTPRNLSTRTGTKKTYVAFDLEGDSGTATAASTTTAITVSGKTWETDRWKGGWVGIVDGTGATRWRRIASNTGNVLTLNRALATAPDGTSSIVIWMSGIAMDGGRVTGGVTSTAIQDTGHTNKWEPNEWVGATITFVGGSAASPTTATVTGNTTDTITFSPALSVNPIVNDSYNLQRLGKVQYVVNTALQATGHRGLYRENTYYSKPGRIWWNGDTPGGWMPETRLPNDDRYRVYRAYDTGSGGGHASNYWPLLRAERKVKADSRLTDQGNGDGMSTACAYGFQSWYVDYQIENDSIGQAVFACLKSTGESWETVYTDTSVNASLTAKAAQTIDLSAYDNPPKLYMGVAGKGDDEIPSTTASGSLIALRTYQALRLTWDLDAFGGLASSIYASGAEVEFYEGTFILRLGGGGVSGYSPPYTRIELGGDGHRLMLPAGVQNHELWISPDPDSSLGLFSIYDPNTTTWSDAPWAGLIKQYVSDGALINPGVVATQADEFAPISPALNLVTNGYFASASTGWSLGGATGGISVVGSWDGTQNATNDLAGTGGSYKLAFSAAPAGAWEVTLTWTATIAVVPGEVYDFGFARRASDTGASVRADMTVQWAGGLGEPDDTIGGTFAATNTWYYAADGNRAFKVPDGPYLVTAYGNTTTANVTIKVSGTGNYTGNVWLDFVQFGCCNLYLSESNMGTISLEVDFQERFV